MNVLMKKGETIVSVKVGVAWSFWFGLAFPIVAIVAYARRRLYIPALIVIGYIVAQTVLRAASSTWIGLVDVIPGELAYANRDFYMVSLLLWCAYGLYVGSYALWGNRMTARSLARRGYVCPVPEHAQLAIAAWSIDRIADITSERA